MQGKNQNDLYIINILINFRYIYIDPSLRLEVKSKVVMLVDKSLNTC